MKESASDVILTSGDPLTADAAAAAFEDAVAANELISSERQKDETAED